jgi:gluconate 2-dehydrogenase alpha chain
MTPSTPTSSWASAAAATIDDLNGNRNDSTKSGFIGGGIVWARQPGGGPVRGIATAPGVPNWGSAWKKGVKEAFRHSFYYECRVRACPTRMPT